MNGAKPMGPIPPEFAARGALQVPAAENIEILVHLAVHNKVFGDLAKMTLAGWDEKSSLAAASDPQTPREVLDYFIAPDNLRPKLLSALLENPSVPEPQLVKLATSAMRDARNAPAFQAWVKAETGWNMEIISGLEEGRLIHRGIMQTEPGAGGRLLLIDLGGGSCEITLSEHKRIKETVSTPLG